MAFQSPHGTAHGRLAGEDGAFRESCARSDTVGAQIGRGIDGDHVNMVNSPLTFIPLEGADQESLTPTNFLLMSSSGV